MNATIQQAALIDLTQNMTPALCAFCGHRAMGFVRGREITFCRFSGERLKAHSMAYGCAGFHTPDSETSTKVFS